MVEGRLPAHLERFLDGLYEVGLQEGGMWNITPDTGMFLHILVRSVGATRILEVGASNGYSTIWLALAAGATGGSVTTLEISDKKAAMARANYRKAGVDGLVNLILGPAAESIPRLDGPFDFVFLDADKEGQPSYIEALIPQLAPNALVVSDNVSDMGPSLADYLDFVRNDPRFLSVMVPIGHGQEVSLFVSDDGRGVSMAR